MNNLNNSLKIVRNAKRKQKLNEILQRIGLNYNKANDTYKKTKNKTIIYPNVNKLNSYSKENLKKYIGNKEGDALHKFVENMKAEMKLLENKRKGKYRNINQTLYTSEEREKRERAAKIIQKRFRNKNKPEAKKKAAANKAAANKAAANKAAAEEAKKKARLKKFKAQPEKTNENELPSTSQFIKVSENTSYTKENHDLLNMMINKLKAKESNMTFENKNIIKKLFKQVLLINKKTEVKDLSNFDFNKMRNIFKKNSQLNTILKQFETTNHSNYLPIGTKYSKERIRRRQKKKRK